MSERQGIGPQLNFTHPDLVDGHSMPVFCGPNKVRVPNSSSIGQAPEPLTDPITQRLGIFIAHLRHLLNLETMFICPGGEEGLRLALSRRRGR